MVPATPTGMSATGRALRNASAQRHPARVQRVEQVRRPFKRLPDIARPHVLSQIGADILRRLNPTVVTGSSMRSLAPAR